MGELEVRDLSLDDRDTALDLRHRSFGPLRADGLAWWDPLFAKMVSARRALGVHHEGVLVAMARLHDYRQLWGGRAVPTSGVAGVVVAPEWRGRGVATLLMTAVLQRSVELGDVLSALFPAAIPPYRSIGYEVAGAESRTTFPAAALRALGAATDPAVRRATPADVDDIVALMQRDATRTRASGPLALSRADVEEALRDPDNFCYLAADGFLVYAWDGEDLRVERLVAETPETTRALWAVVGSGASVVRQVYCYLPYYDPLQWLIGAAALPEVRQDRWMIRVLDARAAVAGRGFPAGVTADLVLRLDDAWLPGCAGRFRLRVRDGSGELVPDDSPEPDPVRLGPNGLAALYAGTPMATLRSAALVTGGGPQKDGLLDTVFAAHPHLIDHF